MAVSNKSAEVLAEKYGEKGWGGEGVPKHRLDESVVFGCESRVKNPGKKR